MGFKLTQVTGLSLMNAAIYLLLFAWAFSVVRKRKLIEPNNVNKYLILMMVVLLASIPVKMLLGEVPNISILSEFVSIKSWANPFILFFIVVNVVDDEKTFRYTLLGLVIFLIITVSTMLLVTFGLMEFGTLKLFKEGRSAGFAEPNQYATYLVLFIPLILTSFLFQRSFLLKVFSAIVFIMAFTGLFVTGSRGGILSFFFSMAVYIVILNQQKMINPGAIILVIAVVIVMGAMSFVLAPSHIKQTVITRFDPRKSEDVTEFTSGRTILLRNGLKIFMERPIFGHGLNTFIPLMKEKFRIRGNSHNDYLLHLVHYGILGLAVFILILTKVFQHVWYHLKTASGIWSKRYYISYLAGFSGYAFSMLGVNVITPRLIFWFYTALIYKYAQLEMSKRA